MGMNGVASLGLCLLVAATAAPQGPIEAGRTALGQQWGGYPWYDSAQDGLRRIDVEPPDYSPEENSATSKTSGSFSLDLSWLSWLVVGILVVLALVLLIRFLQTWDSRQLATVGTAPSEPERPAFDELPFAIPHVRGDLLAEARRLYAEGDYGQAILYLFSYQLLLLDKHQIIRLARGKTNRQYLREVGRRRNLRGLVEQTMVAFEDVFFGEHRIDAARFESCWSGLEQFETLAAEATT